jgi:putative intracellular protease/amidase
MLEVYCILKIARVPLAWNECSNMLGGFVLKQAVFAMMNHYADYEGCYLTSYLNQTDQWLVKTASIAHEVTSLGGLQTTVDYQLTDIPQDVDLLVLIGSKSWALENQTLKSLLTKRLNQHQPVAAICGAVDYLARNGLLTGYRHTGNAQYLWQKDSAYTNPADFVATQAVADRNLVTANGTAALPFTNLVLKMVHFLPDQGVDKATALYSLGFYKYCQQYGNPFA